MSRSTYYKDLIELAHIKRAEYKVTTRNVGLELVRKIYKREGITIRACPTKLRNLRAAYCNDEDGCDVLLNMKLPKEPRLFAMVHELKHHYTDRNERGYICLEITEDSPKIEIGAEIFAGEFIFPEQEFAEYVLQSGITSTVRREDIVRLMYRSPAPISYQFIQKRLEWLGLIHKGQFKDVQFQKLHAQMYGSPHYRQPRVSL